MQPIPTRARQVWQQAVFRLIREPLPMFIVLRPNAEAGRARARARARGGHVAVRAIPGEGVSHPPEVDTRPQAAGGGKPPDRIPAPGHAPRAALRGVLHHGLGAVRGGAVAVRSGRARVHHHRGVRADAPVQPVRGPAALLARGGPRQPRHGAADPVLAGHGGAPIVDARRPIAATPRRCAHAPARARLGVERGRPVATVRVGVVHRVEQLHPAQLLVRLRAGHAHRAVPADVPVQPRPPLVRGDVRVEPAGVLHELRGVGVGGVRLPRAAGGVVRRVRAGRARGDVPAGGAGAGRA